MPDMINGKTLTKQNKVIALFKFIEELNKLKQKSILNMKNYPWALELDSLPEDTENIHVFYRDRVDNEDPSINNILLSVHKPEFQKCPEPDKLFKEWLVPGWDNFRSTVSVHQNKELSDKKHENAENKGKIDNTSVNEKLNQLSLIDLVENDSRNENHSEEDITSELFVDNQARVTEYEKWINVRDNWAEKQKIIANTRNLFADLYRYYFELQRETETEEIIVANGILCDRDNLEIYHPVLTKRVKLEYDPDSNTVYIVEVDAPVEIYTVVFQLMENINLSSINQLNLELQNKDYHPLDRNDTPIFLKNLVHQLSSDSIYSETGMPNNWKHENRLLMLNSPCYIVRKRLDGTVKAIENIVENIEDNGFIPAPISDIVSGGLIDIPEFGGEDSIEEQLASVGGESIDILLSKEANKEQLEIAKRIERYNAVLVQGPPGTGKTHTIANLMGHFLAQGKSVLVTSYTTKALEVLKDKVAPGLQNLCVSILNDSNLDMERSIDGITDYMSKTTSYEVKKEMDELSRQRKKVIEDLADIRRKIFAIINQENNCIVFNGEEISPLKAAEYVKVHTEDLSYIPGNVKKGVAIPLTFEQLSELYRSNEGLSKFDETELQLGLPKPENILSAEDFSRVSKTFYSEQEELKRIESKNSWIVTYPRDFSNLNISAPFGMLSIPYLAKENEIVELKEYALNFGNIEQWMKSAAVDGKNGGASRERWNILTNQIKATCEYAESLVAEQFGKAIDLTDKAYEKETVTVLNAVKPHFNSKGCISKLVSKLHKEYETVLKCATINGEFLSSAEDCDIVLHCLKLNAMKKQCALYWDELLSPAGLPKFFDLNSDSPENIAFKWIALINKYLNWYQTEHHPLLEKMAKVGISTNVVFSENPLDSDLIATDKILSAVEKIIPEVCEVLLHVLEMSRITALFRDECTILSSGTRSLSRTCAALREAVTNVDSQAYAEAYAKLKLLYEKSDLKDKREAWLSVLKSVAPDWSESIRHRKGIHGECSVPSTIEEAWKWKQLNLLVDEITDLPFKDLQKESIRLGKKYRSITSQYAEKCGWFYLLNRTEKDINIKQALVGWKQTVKRIGKGTGKQAPALKAKARELMTTCQTAVPGWIMPINRALESLNPKTNQFDVIIIDEASQSDISSLAILYMGKKLIIVGDDKQVSPMAVGVEVDKMTSLEQMYIKDKIPNSHLYNAKTSIYDIAATTFQPLMLREHFRCVPEIIGFSNMLSYDNRIKPLRDASDSTLLPAVVRYRVSNGKRKDGTKTNLQEAKTIVALMKACFEQPEYEGKTFGIISLLGDEQVREIQKEIEKNIDPHDIISRKILCGNSAHFQGDERDVVFLSVVDSGKGYGPISIQNFGPDDSIRKRYNVAASRARDQLWVVDSLDPSNDLKPGDIRKMLIEYAINPKASELRNENIEKEAESPFEAAVAQKLSSRGYHLIQQWDVGAYRLDIVAVCGKKTVAIECDGDQWHSGEAKIREDMERQTILERLGWRFIRIRGSEFYRDPDLTISRVIQELKEYEIEPEDADVSLLEQERNTELLMRIKKRTAQILDSLVSAGNEIEEDVIATALNTTSNTLVGLKEPNIVKEVTTSYNKSNIGLDDKALKQPHPYLKEKSLPQTTLFDNGISYETGSMTTGMLKSTKPNSIQLAIGIQETKDVNTTHRLVLPPKSAETGSSSIAKTVPQKTMPRTVLPKSDSVLQTKSCELMDLINEYGIDYVDKRASGGSLWIIGGKEQLQKFVDEAEKHQYHFRFKKDGGRVSHHQDAWWLKE